MIKVAKDAFSPDQTKKVQVIQVLEHPESQ